MPSEGPDGNETVERHTITGKDLLVKVEKSEARIEALEAKITDIFDHFSDINEEIGEMRSMIIEREKRVVEMESEFDRMKEAVSRVEPERISKKMESFDQTVLELSAQVEKSEAKVDELRTTLEEFREKFKGIRSAEGLSDMLRELDRKKEDVNEAANHAERMAAKAEKMFLEIDKRLPQMESAVGRISDLEEMMKQMVKDMDAIRVEMKTSVHKEDLKKLWDELDEFKKAPVEKAEVAAIPEPESAEQGEEPFPDIVEIPKPSSEAREHVEKKHKEISGIVDQAYGYLKMGGRSTAMQMYKEALELYKEMREHDPVRAAEAYNDINKLYKDILAQESK